MGVVNVTPDSFSDGGEFLDPAAAIAHGRRLAAEGADILDIGGESTRPGAAAGRRRRGAPPRPAGDRGAGGRRRADLDRHDEGRGRLARALDAGASIVNDVSAFRFAPELAGVVAEAGAECCLMHMLGEPRTMQDDPRYDDVVADVKAFLEERMAFATAAGVREERIWLDPGIGFGKTRRAQPRAAAPARRDRRARAPGRGGDVAQELSRQAHRAGRRRSGCRERSRRTCSRSSAGRGSFACTTSRRSSRRSPWPLLRWAARERGEETPNDDETTSPSPSSRSRSAGSRSTPTTAWGPRSARWASGSSSTSPSTWTTAPRP